jgi:hypothetical protein
VDTWVRALRRRRAAGSSDRFKDREQLGRHDAQPSLVHPAKPRLMSRLQ